MYIDIFLPRITDTLTLRILAFPPGKQHDMQITFRRGLKGLLRSDRKGCDSLTLKMKFYTSEVSVHSPRTNKKRSRFGNSLWVRAIAQILLGCSVTQENLSVILRDYWTMSSTESHSTTWNLLRLTILPPVSKIVIVMRSPHNF